MPSDAEAGRAHVFQMSNGDLLHLVRRTPALTVHATVGNYGLCLRGDADPGFQVFAPDDPTQRGAGKLPSVLSYGRLAVEVRNPGGRPTDANPFAARRHCLEYDGRTCCVEGGALRLGRDGPWIADAEAW